MYYSHPFVLRNALPFLWRQQARSAPVFSSLDFALLDNAKPVLGKELFANELWIPPWRGERNHGLVSLVSLDIRRPGRARLTTRAFFQTCIILGVSFQGLHELWNSLHDSTCESIPIKSAEPRVVLDLRGSVSAEATVRVLLKKVLDQVKRSRCLRKVPILIIHSVIHHSFLELFVRLVCVLEGCEADKEDMYDTAEGPPVDCAVVCCAHIHLWRHVPVCATFETFCFRFVRHICVRLVEVGQLEISCFVDEYVARLEVAVNNTLWVNVFELQYYKNKRKLLSLAEWSQKWATKGKVEVLGEALLIYCSFLFRAAWGVPLVDKCTV